MYKMMCTTTCHIIVEYNLEFAESLNSLLQFVTSWSTPCTTHSLTPKIPSVFTPIFAISDLLGGIHFSTKKRMRT
jgi:hypothetical protein